MTTLNVNSLSASHGQLQAVHSVSLTVNPGEMLFLVGANGAGKTTLLRSIAGDHKPDGGSVTLAGKDLSGLSSTQRARSGLSLVPEGRRLFPLMSVRENLELGASTSRGGKWTVETVFDAFPNLKKIENSPAGELSGGEQQAVAIGRALMGNPLAIVLDEVSLGLSPAAVDLAYGTLTDLKGSGLGMLIVEQDLGRALRTGDELVVMCEGHVTLRCQPKDTDLDALAKASFGQSAEAAE